MFLIPSSWYEIKKAHKRGRGAYATRDIPAGTVIGDYLGTLVSTKAPGIADDIYAIWRNEKEAILPVKEEIGVHLINHSCTPNSTFYPYKGHTVITTLRKIFRGEEITITYIIESPEPGTQVPWLECFCNSRLCRGSMYATPEISYAYWKLEQKNCKSYINKSAGKLGTKLLPLKSYPKALSDFDVLPLLSSAKQSAALLESKVPTAGKVRKLIRESGKPIHFLQSNITVNGVWGDELLIANKPR